MKVELNDGSIIFLREIFIENILTDYSYHWMKRNGDLIVRWDNTFHESYKSLSSFPHHKHFADEQTVRSSPEKNLKEVMNYILERVASS